MTAPRDWVAWHEQYADDGPLSRRLAIVQAEVGRALATRAAERVRVLSMCSGEGRDLIDPVARIAGRDGVHGRLVELDPTLAARARRAIAEAGLRGLEVRQADAGTTTAYAGAAPADLVLVCGVFGNIDDEDIRHTIEALPTLCAVGATVIWTRHRRAPDLTPAIRRWFRAAGFRHEAFHRVPDSEGSVGVERFAGPPRPFVAGVRLFEFRAVP